jgi:capsular polysaccharide transport system permease protein
VRDSKTAAAGTTAGIESAFAYGSAPNASDNYIVVDYITSRQAVEDLMARIDLRAMFSRADVDWLSRFDDSRPMESLVRYWKRMVSATYDPISGIGSAEIRAFTPDDAYKISTLLIQLSEELINKTTNRPQRDAVRFAEGDVARAEERLKTIRGELLQLRNNEQVIDPQQSVVSSNVLLAQTLRANLTKLQTDLSSLKKDKVSDDAPMVKVLQTRIQATREELAKVEAQVASMRDGSNPLSQVVAKFEQSDLDRQFSQNMVLATMQALERARSNLISQHVYVTPFITPSMPASSTYPNRPLAILIVGLVCFLLWFTGQLVVRSIREHHL